MLWSWFVAKYYYSIVFQDNFQWLLPTMENNKKENITGVTLLFDTGFARFQ